MIVAQCSRRYSGSSSTVIPSPPGLPWFCCTRFNAAWTLPRSTTRSIKWSVPERASPLPARDASPLRSALGASPLSPNGSSSCCLAIWRLASWRVTVVPLSLLFGPSPEGLLWPRLTSRPAARRRPFRRQARSPQVRMLAVPAPPPDLRPRALVARASRSFGRSPCSRPPRIRFLFVGARVRSPLPSAPPSRATPCGSLGSLRPGPRRTCTS